MHRFFWIVVGICVLAAIPRLYSVRWNSSVIHGDIMGDAEAALSLHVKQRFVVGLEDDFTSEPHFFPPGVNRNLLIQHPPLWALLGAGISFLLHDEPSLEQAYFYLQIASVISGLLVVFLSYLVASRAICISAGVVMALWVALSYLMIDFSGNGSFYSLHAALFLVWLLIAYAKLRYKAVWLGVVAGIAYLVNYQAMVLAPASVFVLLFATERSKKQRFVDLCVVTLVTLLVTSPWLVRNYFAFGDPFFSNAVNANYLYVKAGLVPVIQNSRSVYVVDLATRFNILHGMLFVWMPNNLYYIARKLFVLAPILFFFFSFAWIDYLFSPERRNRMLPIIVLCVLHLLISTTWPITKFRYFVPLFPLVLLIGLDQFTALRFSARMNKILLTIMTMCFLLVSSLTYYAIPTHTYYYDGAITQDPFHAKGEYNYMKERGFISEKQ